MIKMVATDIDGTIFTDKFSDGVKSCINKLTENGVKVVLVTGRMHCSALHLARQLNLNTPIVSYQGALIKDFDGKTLYQKKIDKSFVSPIIKWADENDVHLNMYINDEVFVEKDDYHIKQYIKGKFVDYKVTSFNDLDWDNINKILAVDYNDADKVSEWVKVLSEKFPQLYIVKSTPNLCEICNPDAKKSDGVNFLCHLWNIKKEEVLCIGDQNNDIELLKAGGISVAMGNSTDDLKEYADFITKSVSDDGFVTAINKFVFKNLVS